MAVIAGINILAIQSGYASSQAEYDSLRLEYAAIATPAPEAGEAALTLSVKPELSEINPDYIGWIRIEDTAVDYPVVRGQDNEKYLSTTFMGENNPSGTIFMDSGCAQGFDAPLTILYGHNMKDGSMFAELNRYREDGYLAEHSELTVVTADGETLVYHIFTVQITDVYDNAYSLIDGNQQAIADYLASLGAPQDAERTLVLSTCTSGGDDNERLLVFAAEQ